MKCWMLLILALGTLSSPSVGDAPLADALKYVPDDGALVVIVPSLEKLAAGVAAFGKSIGVDDLAAMTANEMLAESLGEFAKGVAPGGLLILTVSPDTRDEPVLIATVGDADAWKKNAQADGEFLKFALYGEQHFAVLRDKFIILGTDREVVGNAAKGGTKFSQRFDQNVKALSEGQQLCLFIDVPAWKEIINGGLSMIEGVTAMAVSMGSPEARMGAELIKPMFQMVRDFLAQAETYSCAGRIDGEGIFFRDRLQAKAGGELASYLKKVRKSDKGLLRGIPAGDYAMVFGAEWHTPEGTASLGEAMTRWMTDVPSVREALGAERLEQMRSKTIELYRQISGYNGGMTVAPDGKGMLIAGIYMTKNPESVQACMGEMQELSSVMMASLTGGVTMKTQCEQETIENAKVNAFVFSFEGGTEETRAGMAAIYGDSAAALTTPIAEGLAYVVGPREAAKARLGQMLKGEKQLSADPRWAAAAKRLSPNPQVVGAWDLARLMDFGMSMAKDYGSPMPPMKLSAASVPWGAFALHLNPDSLGVELWLPVESIRPIVDAAKATRQGAQQPPR